MVDCLLPGQVRQLGTRMTYVSARRALKTSARDCAIRGGEYVRHDAADYRSALSVWLAAAEEGDNEARIQVGTIYELGLGRAADYERAAYWYEKAAVDGSMRAQFKLSALYESGLGVPQNLDTARYWYQQASGETASPVVLPPPAASQIDNRTEALREEIDRIRDQSAAMVAENAGLRAELAEARAHLSEASAVNAERAASQQVLETHEARRENEAADLRAKIGEFERLLVERETSIDQLELRLQQSLSALSKLDVRARSDSADAQLRAAQLEALAQDASAAAQTERERRMALEDTLVERELKLADVLESLTAREIQIEEGAREIEALGIRVVELEQNTEELSAARTLQTQALASAAMSPPVLTLLDPAPPVTRGMVKVTVPASVATQRIVGRIVAPAGLLSLTVNGAPAQANPAGIFVSEIELSGAEVPVGIIAIDQLGQRAAFEFLYSPSPGGEGGAAIGSTFAGPAGEWSKIPFGRYHALVIGNDRYRELPALNTAIADAQAIAEVLEQRYGFKVTRLIDADRYQILSALNLLRETLTDQDNLLVYYAGHGELDKVNMRGHWLPVDAERSNSANWISNVAITDILNAMAARQVLLLADSCYSGALTRSALTNLDVARTEAEEINWVRTMLERRARLALTSGGLAPVLDAGGGEHSVFAAAVLDVLNTNEQLLEGRDLYEQVAARVAYRAANLRFEQVPEFAPIRHAGHEAGEFFLVPPSIRGR